MSNLTKCPEQHCLSQAPCVWVSTSSGLLAVPQRLRAQSAGGGSSNVQPPASQAKPQDLGVLNLEEKRLPNEHLLSTLLLFNC